MKLKFSLESKHGPERDAQVQHVSLCPTRGCPVMLLNKVICFPVFHLILQWDKQLLQGNDWMRIIWYSNGNYHEL